METIEVFEHRKRDHMDHALESDVEATGLSGFDQIRLNHEALPDFNFEDISIENQILGHPVGCPIFISSMTAGHPGANRVNLILAEACEARRWAMGVGSQRRELLEVGSVEWVELRKRAPHVVLFGNIGIAQAITSSVDDIRRLVDSLQAQAMIVHLNALQECLQMEGTPQFRGGLRALENLVKHLGVPVVVKETGSGLGPETVRRLLDVGVRAVDVSGLGGTHWGRVEGRRAKVSDLMRAQASQVFADWGIPTVDALLKTKAVLESSQASVQASAEVWSSGGIRHGLDVAKSLAMGAMSVGVARPALQAALRGEETVANWMKGLEFELRVAMFCTGSSTVARLRERTPWEKI